MTKWIAILVLVPALLLVVSACGAEGPSGSPSVDGGASTPAAETATATSKPLAAPDQGSAETDRDALSALYNATGGPGWTNNGNWLSDEPLGEWYGVDTDTTGRVIALDLHDNRLIGEMPTELGQLSRLVNLSFHFNHLTGEIPAELGQLSNLESLDLGINRLSGEIPPELTRLESLLKLTLSGNGLSGGIPPGLGQMSNLEGLHLNGNNLSGEIPPELAQASSLRGLYLARNELSGCIPASLMGGPYNDFDELGLPFC